MIATIYYSKALKPFSIDQLDDICNSASKKNETYGITGYLNYKDDYFFQYIEGEEQNVAQLMSNIQNDQRHQVLNILHDPSLSTRRFPEWRMKYLDSQIVTMEDVIDLRLKHYDNFKDNERSIANLWHSLDRFSQVMGNSL